MHKAYDDDSIEYDGGSCIELNPTINRHSIQCIYQTAGQTLQCTLNDSAWLQLTVSRINIDRLSMSISLSISSCRRITHTLARYCDTDADGPARRCLTFSRPIMRYTQSWTPSIINRRRFSVDVNSTGHVHRRSKVLICQ